MDVSECVELGVSESEELPVKGPARHLTLHLCRHCFPIVSKLFTAIFLYPMLLLHFRFDGLANVLEDHCLYPVWDVAHVWRWRAKRSSELIMRLASWPELENTRFRVRHTCYCVGLEDECFKIDSGLPCLQSMAEYDTG